MQRADKLVFRGPERAHTLAAPIESPKPSTNPGSSEYRGLHKDYGPLFPYLQEEADKQSINLIRTASFYSPLPPPHPALTTEEPVATQTFYFDGTGELVGDYTWVMTGRSDIGAVGEVTGELYTITSIARRSSDSEIIATVKVDAIWDSGTGESRIILWQLNPQ